MRSLPLPDRGEDCAQLKKALKIYIRKGVQKGYDITNEEVEWVLAIYDHYDASLGQPSSSLEGGILSEALNDEIYQSYRFTQTGGKLDSIRTSLFMGVRDCPICGISGPRDLDHHLPHKTYRPLAIYVRNLIPLCHDCNHLKSSQIYEPLEQRYVHPYFEKLPNTQFIRADINLKSGGLLVEFCVDPSSSLPMLLQKRIAFQFERLQLNKRYQREINIYLTGHAVALSDAFEAGGADGVASFLCRQAKVECSAFHPNHWRPVLLDALASHSEFCNGGFRDVLPVLTPKGVQ